MPYFPLSGLSGRIAGLILGFTVNSERIAELLAPFLDKPPAAHQLASISTYIDILVQWNRKVNLTAVRDPEPMVTRHFGESLFAARHLFPSGRAGDSGPSSVHLVDVGSGAGFPGLPIKIWTPEVCLTLIDSNQKKAAFLREVARALTLREVDVFSGRAEDYAAGPADVVTMRAVERFESVLPIAGRLVKAGGQLMLLIGAGQVHHAANVLPDFDWQDPLAIPLSQSRVLQLGSRSSVGESEK